jgi:putative acetyltransferase
MASLAQMSIQPPVTIRPIRPIDIAEVRALQARSFAVLAKSHHSAEQIEAHADLIDAPAYRNELLSNNLLVAEDAGGRILATAGWRIQDDRPGTARIRKVFVAADMAGRGLGRRIVEAAEADARARGFAKFFVRANVNAAPFYERLGYQALESGSMEAANGVALPVVYMEKN